MAGELRLSDADVSVAGMLRWWAQKRITRDYLAVTPKGVRVVRKVIRVPWWQYWLYLMDLRTMRVRAVARLAQQLWLE